MVAVHRGGDGGLGETGGHELEDSHLGGGILACDALIKELAVALGMGRGGVAHVRAELEVRDTTLNLLLMRVVEMTVDDLLGEGERAVQPGVRGRHVSG
jgi:hypothetical protein